jgi:hypothetical protein
VIAYRNKADILNDYFASVCTEDNGVIPPISTSAPPEYGIAGVSFAKRNPE